MQEHAHAGSVVEAFLPHGFCYLWNPRLLWTHVAADLLIGFAYVAISTTLLYLVWKGRREFPFQRMFLAFGLFIVACGATHFVEVYTLWEPAYWFSAGVKVVTAAASVGTAILLPPLVPRALATIRQAKLSEERRAEAERAAAALEHERRFRIMSEALPQIVWTAEPDGSVDYYSHRWFEYTGIAVEGGHGWGWKCVLHPEDEGRTADAWRHSVETGEPYGIEHRMRRADGTYGWMLSRALPVHNADGSVSKWFGSATEIDQQKQTEAALERARQSAEEASRAKDQFLAVMSHELRTPLNAIIGYADLMGAGITGPITPKQEEGIARIRTSSEHLLGLINQVLTFNRSHSVEFSPRPEPVPLAGMLEETAMLVEPLARNKGLDFRLELPGEDIVVETDSAMLRQILLNLLGNAIKFTDSGGVALVAELQDDRLRFEVRDTGCGIAPEQLERVWDPFWQADQALTRRREGAGLGLSVTLRLVESLMGEIRVQSELGVGSIFRVSMPVRRRRPEGAPA